MAERLATDNNNKTNNNDSNLNRCRLYLVELFFF